MPTAKETEIDTLNARQRAHLRSLAHHLKAVTQIGKEGITDTVVRAVEEAFNTRELLKVRVQEAAPMTAAATGGALASRLDGAHHVQTIGRVVVLFRAHPDEPQIRLPDA